MPPVLEPTPPSLARQFYRRRAKVHHSQSRRFLRLMVVALVLVCGWTGWYLAKRGFGREWRDRVSQELHKRGVEASIQRLTLDLEGYRRFSPWRVPTYSGVSGKS